MKAFRIVLGAAALVALLVCVGAPVLFFAGAVSEGSFKTAFLVASAAWFVCAWLWARDAPAGEDRDRTPPVTADRPSSAQY